MRSHLSGQQLCMVFVLNYLADIVKVMQWLIREGLNEIGRCDMTSLSILKLFPVRSKG